jgi:lycopene beta-cyclase
MVDVCIVGGGLAGSLAAWRLRVGRPALTLRIVEAGPTLGGNHTWSFQATDLVPDTRRWMEPLIVARWPRQRVAFPGYARTLDTEYCTVTSERLDRVVGAACRDAIVRGVAEVVAPTHVRLADGRQIDAHLVIDARGAEDVPVAAGWQTFFGQEIECRVPHGVDTPILMDATVPQRDGFRFMYVLPFTPTRLLVEDTAYADEPAIDVGASRAAIAAYAASRGWPAGAVVREEAGRLPIPLGGEVAAYWQGEVPRLGVRAGVFHPTTGYSLPDAVAAAHRLAGLNRLTTDCVYTEMRSLAEVTWRQRRFFRLLNRWLFLAAAPSRRVDVLAQFYTRPEALIARFYGARLTWRDRLQLLAGRPPVPVWRALAQLRWS